MAPGEVPMGPKGPVQFLSNVHPAYSYLEALQEQAYAGKPSFRRWTGSAKDKAMLRDLLGKLDRRPGGVGDHVSEADSFSSTFDAMIARLSKVMPTRYEDPNSVAILCMAALQAHAEVARDTPGFVLPYLGSLPTATLNASARSIPESTTELVVMNVGLFPFIHEFGKIGLATIRIESQADNVAIYTSDDYFKTLRRAPQFVLRVSKAFEDLAKQRSIQSQDSPRELDDPLLMAMDTALEAFVLGHEFAHLTLRHTSRDTHVSEDLAGAQPLSDQALRRLWGEEAVADLYAASVVQRIAQHEYRESVDTSPKSEFGEYVRYAPVLFFQLSEMAEAARFVHDHAALPPAISKEDRAAVLDFLSGALADQAKQLGRKQAAPETSGATRAIPLVVRQFGDHPPLWARRVLVEAFWKSTAPTPKDDTEIAFGTVAIQMGNNLEALWSDLAPLWVQTLRKERSN
jgi:hypothetical protein